jgi:DNA end-binding protein Ku
MQSPNAAHFEPEKFEDHYEAALQDLLSKKQKGMPIESARKSAPTNVVNLMDALKASLKSDDKAPKPTGKPARTAKKAAAKPKRKAS